jgi:hypothetical protein
MVLANVIGDFVQTLELLAAALRIVGLLRWLVAMPMIVSALVR